MGEGPKQSPELRVAPVSPGLPVTRMSDRTEDKEEHREGHKN
jgi:hypothetical protein